MGLLNDWYMKEFEESDDQNIHRAPEEEIAFYRAVATGDMDAVRRNCEENRFNATDGVGKLSRNPVQNLKYHFVVTAAFITRLCVEQGLDEEKAFRLSDFYILKLDQADTIEAVTDLHDAMVMDFTGKMRLLKKFAGTSKPITETLNYIYSHMSERITTNEIAEYIGLSTGYLSRLFIKEIGVSLSDYIREKKIEQAQNLLRYSEYSLVEISARLGFSSQSHFIQSFKARTGVTPNRYRKEHGRVEWNVHVK
jgi:AraC-like DNA-binding protein